MTDETHEIHERLASIETSLQHIDTQSSKRDEKLGEIEDKMDEIEKEFSRYRGFVGGILLVATAVVSFFKIFWDDILDKFK